LRDNSCSVKVRFSGHRTSSDIDHQVHDMHTIYRLVREIVDTCIRPYETELKTVWSGLAFASYFILTSGILTARYGRHFSENSFWPTLNGKLGWMTMEIVSPLTLLLFFLTYQRPGSLGSTGQVLMVLWLLHYLNRAILSPLLSPGMKSTRIDTVLMSMFFNLVNAGWVGYDLALLNLRPFTCTPLTSLGLALFVVGMAINMSSDYYLQSIRRQKGSGGEYVLPEWGLYKYVVSPNYAGEIVEWTGYSIILGRQSGWAFVVWSICNLAPRARSNLAWYREKFGDQVGSRKSLIPGVY
jgi:3-oxo-5-alpha-steroid 4-dehydrogenase 1